MRRGVGGLHDNIEVAGNTPPFARRFGCKDVGFVLFALLPSRNRYEGQHGLPDSKELQLPRPRNSYTAVSAAPLRKSGLLVQNRIPRYKSTYSWRPSAPGQHPLKGHAEQPWESKAYAIAPATFLTVDESTMISCRDQPFLRLSPCSMRPKPLFECPHQLPQRFELQERRKPLQ